jgi:hypothetical protein
LNSTKKKEPGDCRVLSFWRVFEFNLHPGFHISVFPRNFVAVEFAFMGGKTKRAMLSDGNWLGSLAMSAS